MVGDYRPGATRPDSVHILSELPCGARGIYHLSGVVHHAGEFSVELLGSDGSIRYDFSSDRLFAGKSDDKMLQEIQVPANQQGGWNVEADFVDAIRGGPAPQLTDFATGVRYMEFTEAVERSAQNSLPISLPLDF